MTTSNCAPSGRLSNGATFIEDFRSFVTARAFPCVGAKSALQRERIEFAICDQLGSVESAEKLRERLALFAERYQNPDTDPVSFVAIFRDEIGDEDEFHERLWLQLQRLHDRDFLRNAWAAEVSDDPGSADFSFSVASRAFFVVGLHPKASRLARRAPQPTLVFNFHGQFEALRRSGQYEKLQAAIRGRDKALQGDINPVLARFGEGSEALQYSGRAGGICPFRAGSRSQ